MRVKEAAYQKRLVRLQKQLAAQHLLIIDELGFVPLSKPEQGFCSRSLAKLNRKIVACISF